MHQRDSRSFIESTAHSRASARFLAGCYPPATFCASAPKAKAQTPNRNLRATSDNWPRSHVIAIKSRSDATSGGREERYSLLVAKQRRFGEIL
jgi:hypothetical protein